ncbi:MAG: TolC family protein [Cyclobacteriaceae bacterium]
MKSFFTSLILVVLFCLRGSTQDTTKYTLKECVNIALENNLRIKRSVYNIESFNTNLLQAKAAYLPTINLGGSAANNYGRALNPVDNQFVARNSSNINVFGQANLNLFNGFRTQFLFRQSQRDLSASNEDLSKAKNDIALIVITNYTNVIFNQELFSNARYQLKSSEQQLERIKKQVAAGALPKSNQLNQEAQVATNELNLINQENALNLSLLQLKQSMQISGSTKMQVVVPDLSAEDLVLDKSAEDIYQVALQAMPEVKSAMLKVESATMALKANRGNFYPRLSLVASAQSNYSSLSNTARFQSDGTFSLSALPLGEVGGTGAKVFNYTPNANKISDNYGETDQLSDNLFKALTLQLNIPVFNGLQNRTAVQRSIINRELADITVKETQNTLRQSIETAFNDALASSKSYTSSLKQVNAQEEAYRMNKQRFENGATSFVEYQVSENDLFRAKSDLTRAKYNFIFKKKVLDFYQGKPIDY